MKIKLCGLSREEDIMAANDLLPDYIGFVFWDRSRRRVTEEVARRLRSALDGRIKAVGVFVDEDAERVATLVRGGVIDAVQLHGDEDGEYISLLRALADCEIIQAFKVRGEADAEAAEKSSADLVLLDAGLGEGKPFEWELVKGVRRPYLLAGGLTAETLPLAIKTLSPYGVDVSSAVETDGKKDARKMREFVLAARSV